MKNNIAPEDRRFVKAIGEDPNFSAAHNRKVVEDTIREYEAMRKKKMDEKETEYAERADATTTYLKSLEKGGKSSNLEQYFGKRMLAYLRGQQIREQLMAGMAVRRADGQLLKPATA